ncbi:hypothetical protein K443DRAFT_684272, partial [Laccaria amethystina LaAM-08-1]
PTSFCKPTVNEKTLTLLGNAFVGQPSAAATHLLPPNPNFPSTAYSTRLPC